MPLARSAHAAHTGVGCMHYYGGLPAMQELLWRAHRLRRARLATGTGSGSGLPLSLFRRGSWKEGRNEVSGSGQKSSSEEASAVGLRPGPLATVLAIALHAHPRRQLATPCARFSGAATFLNKPSTPDVDEKLTSPAVGPIAVGVKCKARRLSIRRCVRHISEHVALGHVPVLRRDHTFVASTWGPCI